MIHIAIVEDDPAQREFLCTYIQRFSQEYAQSVYINCYADGDELLDEYTPGKYDLILLDIQMKRVNGMDCAKALRERDDTVMLIFITSFAQFAVQGYSVNALDFILKPVQYPLFAEKMQKAFSRIMRNNSRVVLVKTIDGVISLDQDDLLYVEIRVRKLLIHTSSHIYRCSGSLQALEAILENRHFFRCHSAYMINLIHVRSVNKNAAEVAGVQIPVSKHRRRELLDALNAFVGDVA